MKIGYSFLGLVLPQVLLGRSAVAAVSATGPGPGVRGLSMAPVEEPEDGPPKTSPPSPTASPTSVVTASPTMTPRRTTLGFEEITYDDFKEGWGNFDATPEEKDVTAFHITGDLSPTERAALKIQGNSAVFLGENQDVTPYSDFQVHFLCHPFQMDRGDKFFLDYSSNGGSSWQVWNTFTIGRLIRSDETTELVVGFDSSDESTGEARIRFRCEGNEANKGIFIGEVLFEGRLIPTLPPSMSSAPSTSSLPSTAPSTSSVPTRTTSPTTSPSTPPSASPSTLPSSAPSTLSPSALPTTAPSPSPTAFPTSTRTASPTAFPTSSPTTSPTVLPSSAPTQGWEEITFDDFESGWGNFAVISGSNDATLVDSGAVCMQEKGIKSSVFHATNHDVTAYANLRVEVSFHFIDMEGNERFLLEYSSDGGNKWEIMKRFIRGNPFNNNVTYTRSVDFDASGKSYELTTQAKIRFRSRADSTEEYACIDNIKFEGLPN